MFVNITADTLQIHSFMNIIILSIKSFYLLNIESIIFRIFCTYTYIKSSHK